MEQYRIDALNKVKRDLDNMYDNYFNRSSDATEEDNKRDDFIQDVYMTIASVID